MEENNLLGKAKRELQKTERQSVQQIIALVNGAFALIAALAWNEAVKSLIDMYFPAGKGLYSKFFYAIVITIVVVIISHWLTSFSKRYTEKQVPSSR